MDYYVAKNHIYLAEHHIIQNLEADMLSNLSYAAAVPITEYRDRLMTGESAHSTTKRQDRDTVITILDHALARHERIVVHSIKENPVMGFNLSRYYAGKVLIE
jgi:predicted transcriptional regulator YheO